MNKCHKGHPEIYFFSGHCPLCHIHKEILELRDKTKYVDIYRKQSDEFSKAYAALRVEKSKLFKAHYEKTAILEIAYKKALLLIKKKGLEDRFNKEIEDIAQELDL